MVEKLFFTVKLNNYNHMIFVITSSKARGIGKKLWLLVACDVGMAMCKILNLHVSFCCQFSLITFSVINILDALVQFVLLYHIHHVTEVESIKLYPLLTHTFSPCMVLPISSSYRLGNFINHILVSSV